MTRGNAIAMKAHNFEGRPKKLKHAAKLKEGCLEDQSHRDDDTGQAVDAGAAADDEEGKTIARALLASLEGSATPAPAPGSRAGGCG